MKRFIPLLWSPKFNLFQILFFVCNDLSHKTNLVLTMVPERYIGQGSWMKSTYRTIVLYYTTFFGVKVTWYFLDESKLMWCDVLHHFKSWWDIWEHIKSKGSYWHSLDGSLWIPFHTTSSNDVIHWDTSILLMFLW